MVNTQGRESGGSWVETCSGVWYPRRRPCGVAINTLVDLNKLAGETPSFLDEPRGPELRRDVVRLHLGLAHGLSELPLAVAKQRMPPR